MVTAIAARGAAAIGFYAVFAAPDRASEDNDHAFAQAIRVAPVVLGEAVVGRESGDGQQRGRRYSIAINGDDPAPYLTALPAVTGNLPALHRAASGHGVMALIPDGDGFVRRMPMFVRIGDRVAPSLSMEMLRVAIGQERYVIATNPDGILGAYVGPLPILLDQDGAVWPRLTKQGPRVLPAHALLAGDGGAAVDLRDSLVLIGPTVSGLRDTIDIALHGRVAYALWQAHVLQALVAPNRLLRTEYADIYGLLAAILVALAVLAATLWLGAGMSIAIAVLAVGAVVACASLSYARAGYLLDASFATAIAVLLLLILLAVRRLRII